MLAAQRALVRARCSAPRAVEMFAPASKRFDAGLVHASPRRVVVDGVASESEVRALRAAAARALSAIHGAAHSTHSANVETETR